MESLNATYEQYKFDTEKELRTKSVRKFSTLAKLPQHNNDRNLQAELTTKTQRLDALQQDLTTAHRDQMELAQQLENARTEFENDKRMLEATIADLSTVEDRALSNQASIQEDLRRQAQVAQVRLVTVQNCRAHYSIVSVRMPTTNIRASLSLMLKRSKRTRDSRKNCSKLNPKLVKAKALPK